jgi:hypothetical protein
MRLLPEVHHWVSKFSGPKNGPELEYKCSAYLFENKYRCCMSCPKQKYYFEIDIPSWPDKFDYLQCLEEYVNGFFIGSKQNCQTAKCARCSKWAVIEGVFCPRCQNALDTGNTELDIVI